MSRATGRRDINKAGGEGAEFPIVCETCLGPNPYVRMSKQDLGAECKVCTRPFTVFKWQPGTGARYKKTEVCQTCSKSRNVCQTCLLDLQFGLPTQVRDTALGIKKQAPTSDINREFYAQNIENAIENGIDGGTGPSGAVNFGKADPKSREMLKKLARNDPYYHRNRPHICSFFVKGNCTRGDACPYRHEMPKEGETLGGGNVQQSIRDRFHGTNDPVARRMLASAAASTGLAAPSDTSITSLYFTSIPESHNTKDALTAFIEPLLATAAAPDAPADESNGASTSTSSSQGGIRGVVPVPATSCAFVNFRNRKDAEAVANVLAMRNISRDPKSVKISYGEEEVGVQWGRSKKPKATTTASASASKAGNGSISTDEKAAVATEVAKQEVLV